VTAPHADVSTAQAFFVEFIATMVLIGVCTGLWDPRNAKHGDSIPIKFGLTVAALALVAGPYTGCKFPFPFPLQLKVKILILKF
jgi:aquaporin rerated protein, invertebrate